MADNNPKEEPLKLEPTLSVAEHDEKPVPKYEKTDYSGAHEKTDPKEIALVKKLDRWIMVCHVACFKGAKLRVGVEADTHCL
jgi:hypothetical protein